MLAIRLFLLHYRDFLCVSLFLRFKFLVATPCTSLSPEDVVSSQAAHELSATLSSVLVSEPQTVVAVLHAVVCLFQADAPNDVSHPLLHCSQPLDDCSQPLDDCFQPLDDCFQPLDDCSLSEAHSCHPQFLICLPLDSSSHFPV